MLDGMRDDASFWTNFSPQPHPAESERMAEIIGDETRSKALLDFGFRPFGPMDLDPYQQPKGLNGPWQPKAKDLSADPILVDVQTGWRFRYESDSGLLRFDVQLSDNYIEAQVLLSRAMHRDSPFKFEHKVVPAYHAMAPRASFPVMQPLELSAADPTELETIVSQLDELLRRSLGAKRLWFRGQRQEYLLTRSQQITEEIYGVPSQPSMHPSLGRYAAKHPDKMDFGFAFAGPNHWWKKPFLIWLMRENQHWFERDRRCLEVLDSVLKDKDDERFVRLLLQIQMSGQMEVGDPPFVEWPDEADDLRQWFFAFMKRHEFGITLQQYGYYASLIDVTDSLDVALYFSQAQMRNQQIRKHPSQPGRVIYVFAESKKSGFFRHGKQLFWGEEGWVREMPQRLKRQQAGFFAGSTNRTQNFCANMLVATIRLGAGTPETTLNDEDLFPRAEHDLLLRTLQESQPAVEGLY